MRRSSLFLVALASLVISSLLVTARAETPQKGALTWREIPSPKPERILPRPARMDVRMDVLVDGRSLRVVHHAGRDYLPVPRHGLAYEIRVRNNGPRRVTAVVSVDGLSVITRQPASADDPGYLIGPRDEIVIIGFRRDRDTVAQFRFEERDRSYATRIGHDENVGVIGLVAIEEKTRPDLRLEDRVERGRFGASKAEVGGTGTEAGEDVYSPSYRVPFVRGKNQVRTTLYYDTVDALRRAGVPVDSRWPMPFPRDR